MSTPTAFVERFGLARSPSSRRTCTYVSDRRNGDSRTGVGGCAAGAGRGGGGGGGCGGGGGVAASGGVADGDPPGAACAGPGAGAVAGGTVAACASSPHKD